MTILDIAKPLIDRGTKITGTVIGTAAGQAGQIIGRFQRSEDQPKTLTDPTLKTKVESTIFRLPGVSKSKVDVTVADGVVTLHGEVRNQAQMTSLQNAVQAIPEVTGVESELHLPKTPAPSTPKAGQRRQTKPKATAKPAQRTERVNRDRTGTTANAEPKPIDLAAKRQGRQPAPLGAKDPQPKLTEAPKTAAGTRAANGRKKTQADSPVKAVSGTGVKGS